MSSRLHRAAALGLLTILSGVAACSGSTGTGTGPTTTEKPYSTRDMCTAGQNAYSQLYELDQRDEAKYVDEVKRIVKSLPNRAPADLRDDMKAWVDYVQSITKASQLAAMPDDYKVATGRIDEWWQKNCGKPLFG